MSGITARAGFAFQDLVLAERVMRHILEKRAADIVGASVPALQFFVEATAKPGGGPEWDLVQINGTEVVVKEAKSGEITAEDRWTLWRRIRSTMQEDLGATSPPRVRLVVNADNPPPKPENWRALPLQSQQVPGQWLTPTGDDRRRSVLTAEDLANEALHVLTSADADAGTQPLTLDAARRILANFSLEESLGSAGVAEQVRQHLSLLSHDVGADELLSALRGEISRRAESSTPAAHCFTSEDLLKSLSVLERLATLSPDDVRRWRVLRECAAANSQAVGSTPSGLQHRDWRDLHPKVVVALDSSDASGVAVLGRGGMGKSVILRDWISQRAASGDECLLLSATELANFNGTEVAAALELGLFLAKKQGTRLCVGVDAVENVVSRHERAALLAALGGIAAAGVPVCVTSRLVEWRSARGTSEDVAGWRSVELDEWPESVVQAYVGASDRPNVGTALLKLLRTPLLLDLFLRTFGRAESVPPGLQTRHGLIAEYWNRRICPEEDERSSDRRSFILGIVASEAVGIRAHTSTSDEAKDLTSEGLLSLVAGGRRVFRHALLRDYAMGEWLEESTGSAKEAATRLSSITSPLLQFGALRARLEKPEGKPDAPRARLPDVLRELPTPLLTRAGTILGEFDDVSQLDIVRLVDPLPSDAQEAFLSALFASVKLAHTRSWLVLFSGLPADEAWAESRPWLTARMFGNLQSVIESFTKDLPQASPLALALASRLRAWASAPRIWSALAAGAGWHLGQLGRLLIKLDPSVHTARWLLEITKTGSDARFWVLTELPTLAQSMPQSSNGELLRRVYLAASSLREASGILQTDPGVPSTVLGVHDRIVGCLIHEGKGLLITHRAPFMLVSAELIAGHEQDLADEDAKRNAETGTASSELLEPLNELLELRVGDEERRARIESTVVRALQQAASFQVPSRPTRPFASSFSEAYWETYDSEYYELVEYLRNLLTAGIASKDATFGEIDWPQIRASASGRMRACVLDLLTRSGTAANAAVVDELLQDERVYLLSYAQPYLQRGIQQRWALASEGVRAAVLDNIRYCSKSPSGGIWRAGPLYHAIPEGDRPEEASVFLELYEVAGHSLDLDDSQSDPFAVAVPYRPEPQPRPPVAGLPPASQTHWAELAALPPNHPAACSDDQWAELVTLVRNLVARSLPSPEHLLGHTELLAKLTEFVDAQRQRATAKLEAEHLNALASWSLSVLKIFSASELVEEIEPLDGAIVGLSPKSELWVSMAQLGDRLLWHPEVVGDATLNGRLFDAVAAFRHAPPDRLAYHLLARITGWFRGDGAGRAILRDLLSEIRNGGVLSRGLRWLVFFTPNEQASLLSAWFTEGSQSPIDEGRLLARKGGGYVGAAALVRNASGQASGSKGFLHELLATPPTQGLLAEPELYHLFLAQTVFGAKQALVNDAVPLERATEYFDLVLLLWKALKPSMSDDPGNDQAGFALWSLGPILDTDPASDHSLKTANRMAWWRAAESLTLTIIRQGRWHEIADLTRQLDDSEFVDELGVDDIKPLLAALDERVQAIAPSEPSYRWEHALSSAASLAGKLAPRADVETKNWMFATLSAWSSMPISSEKAGEVARELRDAL